MRVNEKESFDHPTFPNHLIQFGISTWTQNEQKSEQEESIRRAVYNENGVFSPHGSSEIPIKDMGLLIRACIERNKISIEEMTEISELIKRKLTS